MKNVGLNIRLTKSLRTLIEDALRLQLTIFQSFLVFQHSGSYINEAKQAYDQFVALKGAINLFIHASYKINLASEDHRESCYYLKKELELAQRLGAEYLILHPGCSNDFAHREQGIDAIAKKINSMLKKNDYPTIVLENVSFIGRNIGGDLLDLAKIRSKIDKPEKVKFCIDTAHAYSFGYNMTDLSDQRNFVDLIDDILGIDSVVLIHANDTKEKIGSHHDCHAVPGAGNIGIENLKNFINHEKLCHIPVIIELPVISEEETKKIIDCFKEH